MQLLTTNLNLNIFSSAVCTKIGQQVGAGELSNLRLT